MPRVDPPIRFPHIVGDLIVGDLDGSPTVLHRGAEGHVLVVGSNGLLEWSEAPQSLVDHVSRSDNPHGVTKAQVGLSDVDNTADAIKPVSGPVQAALNLKVDTSTLAGHITDFTDHITNVANPHSVTAAQVGAITPADLALHTGNVANPHSVTAAQVGAPTTAELAAHTGNTSNPHNVTTAQIGAAELVHTHDERYYTEPEVDSLVNGVTAGQVFWGGIGGTLSNQLDLQAALDSVTPVWGSITGILSDQLDLQAALDAKLASGDAPELIRDTIGTALVAGANITVTPNDAANTITISAADAAVPAWGSITGTLSSQTDLQAALDARTTDAEFTAHTGNVSNPHAVTKAQVGLSNVDNTSDLAKPISTATQTALDARTTDAEFTAHTGNVSNPHSVTAAQVGAPTTTAFTAHTGNVSNPHAVTKAQVGLSNVDNTSDANKPVSTATQTALNLKLNNADAPELVRDTMGTALVAGSNVTITPNDAGDTITIASSYVDTNTTDPEVVRDTMAAALVAGSNVTITPNDAGNTITIASTDTNTDVAAVWGNVTGTLSSQTDLQAALDARTTDAEFTAHTGNTNNPHAVTKAQVGLSNVDNTSDLAKPISTATQTALNLKLDSSAAPELIRDTIGTAMTEGPGITITVSDVGETITIGSRLIDIESNTVGATSAKVASVFPAGYTPQVNDMIRLTLTNQNVASGTTTLSINGSTARPITVGGVNAPAIAFPQNALGKIILRYTGSDYSMESANYQGIDRNPGSDFFMNDEFIAGDVSSGRIGDRGWFFGNGTATIQNAESSHQGIARRSTAAAAQVAWTKVANSNVVVTPGNISFDSTFIIRPGMIDSAVAYRFGFSSDPSVASPTNGIYIERGTADSLWYLVTRSNNVQTRVSTGVTAAANWVKVTLRRFHNGTTNVIGAKVNTANEVTSSTNIDTGWMVPFFHVQSTTTTAKHMDADYWDFHQVNIGR